MPLNPGTAPRRRLAPPWALALSGGAMLLLIALIFPRASVFQELGRGGDPDRGDSVRVLFLRGLLAKGEKGFSLRRDYVRQLGLTGDYAGAFAELDGMAAEWRGASRDSLWMLEMETASWALAARGPAALGAGERLRARARDLLESGEAARLPWAAEKAGAAGEYALAARLYLKAAASDPASPAWYRRAAAMSLAAGDCRGAAEALLEGHDRLGSEKERKDAFLDALRSLQGCGRLDEALAAADRRMEAWGKDTEVLLYLVHLAQSADRPKAAQRYAQLLVKPLAAGPEP